MSEPKPAPSSPYLSEAARSLHGLLLMAQKRPEGVWFFHRANASILGSFRAYLWCLPAQCFSWSLIWNVNFSNQLSDQVSRLNFILTNACFDLLAWLALAAIIYGVITITTKDKNVAPVIIGNNWFNLLAIYIFFIPTGLQYIIPGTLSFGWMIDLITLGLVLGLYFRVMRQLTMGNGLLAFALTVLNISLGIFITQVMYGTLPQI